jgi:hypothetical protein
MMREEFSEETYVFVVQHKLFLFQRYLQITIYVFVYLLPALFIGFERSTV